MNLRQTNLRQSPARPGSLLQPTPSALLTCALVLTPLALVAGCGGSSSSGSGTSSFDIVEASHGHGQLLPHRVSLPDANGQPSGTIISIRTEADLTDNVTATNPVLPNTEWPTAAILPNGVAGNHFIYVRFSQSIDFDSVFTKLASAQVKSNLNGTISVTAVDPATGQVSDIRGRAFINGETVAGPDPDGDPSLLGVEQWVRLDGNGKPQALTLDGFGFPGTQDAVGFSGDEQLVRPDTLVFIPDSDGDLTTHETFPTGRQIRLRVLNGVRSSSGELLERPALASATVGADTLCPEVSRSPSTLVAEITPAQGQTDVDPRTNVIVEFTEPVQPFSVGPLPVEGKSPSFSGAVQLQFGVSSGNPVPVSFTARPLSVFDLTRYELDPSFDFPGSGPVQAACATFNQVDVSVSPTAVLDLTQPPNVNTEAANSFFLTGEGPGLVNAPVTPDVVFIGRSGSLPGISVIDLNGFGAGTGNPDYDPLNPIMRGNSNYPNNPNLLQANNLVPPLATQGTCTFDGGSEGAFTLTKDSALDDRVVKPPIISSISDMMLGQPLDTSFNNGPPPLGCQAGGGNLCASSSLKVVMANPAAPNTLGPTPSFVQSNQFTGQGNLASWSPHPNPPPLVFPPLCQSPLIGAQEPTSVDSTSGLDATGTPILITNLLGPNPNFLGVPGSKLPPSGLATPEQNAFFVGPSAPQISVASCSAYQIRQQIGYFLYVVDRVRREVVVLNSNRFTVLDRIPLPDPTSLAMSPNLEFLAVSNQSAGSVSFVDINPSSSSFHTVIQTTKVENGPRGLAWDTGNEDIFVCNEQSNSVSIISAFSFQVRKTVRNQLFRPFEVALTQRQSNFGFSRNVYFAFILNRDGSVALFESGPNGVNGWGFDEIVGRATFDFQNPKAIAVDGVNLQGGCWVVHENPIDPVTGIPIGTLGQPAVSNLVLETASTGQQPLDPSQFGNPQVRDLQFRVRTSIGPDQITGVPVDIAFDNLMNFSGLPNTSSFFSAGSPLRANGKSLTKFNPSTNSTVNMNEWTYMFLAVPTSDPVASGVGGGVVDVLDRNFRRVDTNPFDQGDQSIPAQGVTLLMDYTRQ